MKLWNRRHEGCISHFTFEKETFLLKKEAEALELAKMQKQLVIDRQQQPEPEDFEYCRQLDIKIAQTEIGIKALEELPREGQALLDVLLMRIFKWATKERFIS